MKILTKLGNASMICLLAILLIGVCSSKPVSAAATATKITMNCNGGAVQGKSVYTTTIYTTAEYGSAINYVKPTRTGYIFDGWYSAANGGTKADTSHVYTNVYAHWILKITGNKNGGGVTAILETKNSSGSTGLFYQGAETDLWFIARVSNGSSGLDCFFAPNFTGSTRTYRFEINVGNGKKISVQVEQPAQKLNINANGAYSPIPFSDKAVVKNALYNIYLIYNRASQYMQYTKYGDYAKSAKVAYLAVDLWGINYKSPGYKNLPHTLESYQKNGLDCGMLVSAAYALYDNNGFEWLEAYNTDNCRGMLNKVISVKGSNYAVSDISKSIFVTNTRNSHKIAPGTILVYKQTENKNAALYSHVGLYLFNYEGNPYTIEASASYNRDGIKGIGQSCVRQIQDYSKATLSAYANPFYKLK